MIPVLILSGNTKGAADGPFCLMALTPVNRVQAHTNAGRLPS